MAKNTTIANMFVSLSARTDKLESDLKKARAKATKRSKWLGNNMGKSMGQGFNKRFLKFAAPAALAAAFTKIFIDGIKIGAQIDVTSKKIGFSAKALQELQFAGSQVNLTTEQVNNSLRIFARRVGEAAMGTGELKADLERYNIELKNSDGTTRQTKDVLMDFADAIQGADGHTEKMRLTMKGMDSEGIGMITILTQGSEGMLEFAAAADRAGVIMKDSLIAQLSAADSKMQELMLRWDVFKGKIAGATLTVMDTFGVGMSVYGKNEALEGLLRDLERLKGYQEWFNNLNERERALINLVKPGFMGPNIRRIKKEINNLPDAMIGISTEGDGGITDEQLANMALREKELLKVSVPLLKQKRDLRIEELRALVKIFETSELLSISEEDLQNLIKLTNDEFDERVRIMQKSLSPLAAAWTDLGEGIKRAISTSLIEGEKSFKGFLQNVLKQLAAAAIETAILTPLFGALGLDRLFSAGSVPAGRASGGPVSAGSAYVVGEQGPELFMPRRGGMIIPNGASFAGAGGGNVTVNQVLNFNTDLMEVQSQIMQAAPLIAGVTTQKIKESKMRGRNAA